MSAGAEPLDKIESTRVSVGCRGKSRRPCRSTKLIGIVVAPPVGVFSFRKRSVLAHWVQALTVNFIVVFRSAKARPFAERKATLNGTRAPNHALPAHPVYRLSRAEQSHYS